jgi:Flp pilus assembly protein protease CpaA
MTTISFAELAIVFLIGPLLIFAVISDIAQQRISTELIIGVLVMGIVLQTLERGPDGLLFSLGGAAVGFLFLLPFGILSGSGAGNARLLAAAGGFLGPWGTLLAGTIALGASAALGLIWLAWLTIRASIKTRRAGSERSVSGPDPDPGPRVPYSIAVALGIYLAASQLYGPDPETIDVAGRHIAGLLPW